LMLALNSKVKSRATNTEIITARYAMPTTKPAQSYAFTPPRDATSTLPKTPIMNLRIA